MPQLVLLSYVLPDGTGDSISLDASVNEQHAVTAQVTEHQVERGPNVNDYIRPMPRKVTIEGVVTDTPIAAPPSQADGATAQERSTSVTVGGKQVTYKAIMFSSEFHRVRDVYGGLVQAALSGALFTVVTTLALYDNMAIVNFAVPRNVESTASMRFTVDFQEIRIVETKTVAIPVTKAKKHRGTKAGKEVSETTDAQKKSTLKAIVNSMFGK